MWRMVLFVTAGLLVLPAVVALWGLSRCWRALREHYERERKG